MSLHSTTDTIRKFVLWICIGVGAVIFIYFSIGFAQLLFPKKQLPPTVSFGKLPPIAFPPPADTSPVNYVLNTISGAYPVLPDRATVYQIAQPQPDLLALNNAKALIPQQEFPNDPQAISDIVYQWKNPTPPFQILTYNILTHDFTLTSAYATDSTVVAAATLGDGPAAIASAKQFLNGFNAYPTDIDETKTTATLYSINATTLTLQPAISLSTTQVIQVDFFQKDINQIPIYYPNPPHSVINALIGSSSNTTPVVAANATIKSITNTSATYPIKSAQQAFKELQQGKAFIAAPANPPLNPIMIRTIALGYYIGQDAEQNLMPIIVLQGDNGFFAYVSAVTDAWIQK